MEREKEKERDTERERESICHHSIPMTPPVKKNATAAAVGKKKMRTVQSGIGISSLDKAAGSAALSLEQSFLTSRTARVLLAGAGFLADAVRKIQTVLGVRIRVRVRDRVRVRVRANPNPDSIE